MIASRLSGHTLLRAASRGLAIRPSSHIARTSSGIRPISAMAQPLIHYDSKTCPYAQRAWMTLLEKGLPFELRQVDLANKSAEFEALYASISPDPAASAKVPILIDGDTKLIESSIIVEYLAAKYREEGTDLLPTDPADAARARLFAETFSTGPWAGFLALLRAGTPAALEEAKAKTSAGFAALNTCLEKHGREEDGGSYFLGLQYSLADALTVSLLQRILVAIPILRGIDTNALLQEHTRAARWAAAVLARPSAVETQPEPEVMANSLRKYLVPIEE